MSPAEVNYFLNLEVQQFFRLDVYGWNMCKNKYIYVDINRYIPMRSMYSTFTYICWIFLVNVSDYTSPMDAMG